MADNVISDTGRSAVEELFLERYDLKKSTLLEAIGTALASKADDADIYFESTANESAILDEGEVKRTSLNVTQGAGVRVLAGERTGYAHTNQLGRKELQEAAQTARAIGATSNESKNIALTTKVPSYDLYPVAQSPVEVPLEMKTALLSEIDVYARGLDPRIKNVTAQLAVEHKSVLMVRADGQVVGDVRPLVVLSISCVAEEDGNRQTGRSGGGGRYGFDYFLNPDTWKQYVDIAVNQALINLKAVDCPAGSMTVVLGPGWPGVLLHEAIGHGLEGDFNRKGTSAFSGRVGERVATELCTIVDDGTIEDRRGSLNVDDEGTPTGRTVLIEKGILKGYMHDRLNARLMGHAPTGNGRRQSFAHTPMPRMTNTFMLAGDSDPEEIVKSVKNGIYAVNFSGGQVDITSGRFVFSACEAYLIENGQVTAPVKGATLIGNGPDVLTRVSMVGSDMALDMGVGTCGKDGQSVPVGVGLPTIRLDGITVGGTA